MGKTSIEWTDENWNPSVGCKEVSPGCKLCYAARLAHRGLSASHRSLTVIGNAGPHWTGEFRFLPERLNKPLSWRKPRRVFVDSMSDLFGEGIANEQIAAVFGVMAACPQHTFQVLTKRAKRMREWFGWLGQRVTPRVSGDHSHARLAMAWEAWRNGAPLADRVGIPGWERAAFGPWPLPNVWLGVSVEDQRCADERIPELLACPAAVRFVSYEPALGPVRFTLRGLPGWDEEWKYDTLAGREWASPRDAIEPGTSPRIDWVIVGGESGPGARPFDLAWARSTIAQCRAAGVRVFVKQIGARPYECAEAFGPGSAGYDPSNILEASERPRPPQMDGWTRVTTATGSAFYRYPRLADKKGGAMEEWPEDLRERVWPEAPRG